ncbi:hypothetical protein [Streptomyces sp. NPDC001480]|uniref:hypothetical protein n=1 Tax=Streptomyces sp. NPDC001480 TaxID=3364577 RepID=UPI0036B51C67
MHVTPPAGRPLRTPCPALDERTAASQPPAATPAYRGRRDKPLLDPQRPVRHRLHDVERYDITCGGEYWFLPSLSVLRWLADPRA